MYNVTHTNSLVSTKN